MPQQCLSCRTRPCEQTVSGAFDLCQYGVLFHNTPEGFVRHEPSNPIRHLAINLRHELNPILSFIVNQLVVLDETVSSNNIDTDTPAGRLLGATLILDDAIQMITGVHDFHPLARVGQQAVARDLADVILNRFAMYSLIGGANRTRGLEIDLRSDRRYKISYARNALEYLFSVLVDNAWKFAVPESTLDVRIRGGDLGMVDATFSNKSAPLPEEFDPFLLGAKASVQGKGFGYGLHWAALLVDRYNEGLADDRPPAVLTHRQIRTLDDVMQEFEIRNLRVEE